MENVSKELKCGIEIYDYNGPDYQTAMRFGKWRVAYLNHAERFDPANFKQVERHNESDEVFVLLSGNATLIIGEELHRIEMEPHKMYNVPAGVWHHIFTNEDTSVLIVENEDTGDANSDFLNIENK